MHAKLFTEIFQNDKRFSKKNFSSYLTLPNVSLFLFHISKLTGDLFDMLLPMLSIYQGYVRNHHYSLQVLTECKSNPAFATVLKRLEGKYAKNFICFNFIKQLYHTLNVKAAKPQCKGRSLEQFLTYPMHQIPRYIITLHELLAHTPFDHVERPSLQNARQQLEDLSR